MKVYLGADHRGYVLKEKVKKWLTDWNYSFEDYGAYKYDQEDDYTFYAGKVAPVVADDNQARGILICGSGVGVDVAANKFDGVRSSIGKNKEQIKAGRNDDNMNVLVIAADYTNDEEASEMIRVFLETEFSGKDRYKRRLDDITKIEDNN